MKTGLLSAFILATLALAGCGTGGAEPGAGEVSSPALLTRAQPVAAVGSTTVQLRAGWNALAFQYQQLATLNAPGELQLLLAYDGTTYIEPGLTTSGVNAGDGTRRGFWAYATRALSLTYAGQDDSLGNVVSLRSGWNLVGFPSTTPIATSQLTAQVNGQLVPLSSSVLPVFYSWSGSSYTTVDANAAGAQLNPGAAYWIYARSAARLSWASAPAASPTPVPVGSPAVGMVPLTDLGTSTYRGFSGGLFENGSNTPPPDHQSAGLVKAAQIQPRDSAGNPDPNGKMVLLSLGMSNAALDWFGNSGGGLGSPSQNSVMHQAVGNAQVNHRTLTILNGAQGGQSAQTWIHPTDANYDRVRDQVLASAGVTERQVQACWIEQADPSPTVALPDPRAYAYTLESELADTVRAARVRYPNLQMVFFTSRCYAGYATTNLNPEPYAYESGFSVKFLIQAQVDQMRSGQLDPRVGDLNYNGVAPFLTWGGYTWADGATPRSDGLTWAASDFNPDGTHPSASGIQKTASQVMNFFLSSPLTAWFRA